MAIPALQPPDKGNLHMYSNIAVILIEQSHIHKQLCSEYFRHAYFVS